MLYLFLDESGDLGFDFVNKKPSAYFVITVMTVDGKDDCMKIKLAIKRTLKKLNSRKGKKRFIQELKGSDTTISVKKYFYEKCKDIEFGIYSLILKKKKVSKNLTSKKTKLYNHIACILFDNVPMENTKMGIEFIMDKCKRKIEIKEFNDYILQHLKSRIATNLPIYFDHSDSKCVIELQATDLFSWGIFRKYSKKDTEWYQIFSEQKIKFEDFYGE